MATWNTIGTGDGTVISVSGTTNRITITGTATDPIIDIASTYVGQTSITTLGTITTGIWNGTTMAVANGGTGATSLTNHGILLGHGTSTVTSTTLTNGQLLVGSTGNDPVAATLTSGTGIFVSTGAGTITISATDVPNNIIDATSGSFSLMTNTIYITDNGASLVTYLLPNTAVLGDYIEVVGNSSGGWKITQNANQVIKYGKKTTTTGTSGFLSSTLQYDCIRFRCIVGGTSTVWVVTSSIGNITFN